MINSDDKHYMTDSYLFNFKDYLPFIDSYEMALEGWRRGLTLSWHSALPTTVDGHDEISGKVGNYFSLSNGEKQHFFYKTIADKFIVESRNLAMNRDKLAKKFKKENINFPDGKLVSLSDDMSKLLNSADEIGYPLVMKTNCDGLSWQINDITNQPISNKTELEAAWISIKENNEMKEVYVEKFIQGTSYQYFFINGALISAIKKGWPFVKKDSMNSLENIPVELSHLAIKSSRLFKNMPYGFIDMVVAENSRMTDAYIVNISPIGKMAEMLSPLEGKSLHISSAIIDHFFPDSKNYPSQPPKLYFKFEDVIDPLVKKYALDARVDHISLTNSSAKRFVLKGEVQDLDFHFWIRKMAYRKRFHGHLQNLDDGKLEVVLFGNDLEEDESTEFLTSFEHAKVKDIKIENWESPVEYGFEIYNEEERLKNESGIFDERLESMEARQELLLTELQAYEDSLSWKATKTLRNFFDKIKSFLR